MGKKSKSYTYSTSEKSYLDIKHDDFWNDTVKWINTKYPSLTPNQLTLMGATPILLLVCIHLIGIFGSFVFPLFSVAIIWYLNLDAMDGKLARHSNRASPIAQVMDHGIDTLIGGLVSIMVCHFLGFESILFTSLASVLTTTLFYLASLKEYLTREMIMSMRFQFGRTPDMSVVLSTTEMLYALAMFFGFGWYSFMGNWIACSALAIGFVAGLVYLNDSIYRSIVTHTRNTENSSYDSTDSSNSNSSSNASSNSSSDSGSNSKPNSSRIVRRRRQIYDANMMPTGEYMDFDLEFDTPHNYEEPTTDQNSNGIRDISIPDLTTTLRFFSELKGKVYFNFVVVQLLSLLVYILTAGSVFQLVMMVLYSTSVTVDLIFLNTLKLDNRNNKNRVVIKRFSNRSAIIFSLLKVFAFIFGVIAVIVGFIDTMHIVNWAIVLIDLVYIAYLSIDLVDKKDVVETYFK